MKDEMSTAQSTALSPALRAQVERIDGVVYCVEFVDDETRDADDDREAGTYVTVRVSDDRVWGPGKVVIERDTFYDERRKAIISARHEPRGLSAAEGSTNPEGVNNGE